MDSNKLPDKEYFEYFLECFKAILLNYPSGIRTFIKDSNFAYQAISPSMIDLYCGACLQVSLGESLMTNKQPKQAVLIAKHWIKQDIAVQKTLESKTYLEVVPYKNEYKIRLSRKTPIINPYTNNFVGIRGENSDMIWPHVIKTLLKMNGVKGLLMGDKNNFKDILKLYPLNKRQLLVLFFCINNYTHTEISALINTFGINLSPSRVNDYLGQLKFIFGTRCKSQLVEKALGLGFNNFLPQELFNKFSSIDISNQVMEIIDIKKTLSKSQLFINWQQSQIANEIE